MADDVPKSAKHTRRAFETASFMAGLDGTLMRLKAEDGKARTKPIKVIYDHARAIFKAGLDPTVKVGDVVILMDGRRFRVTAVKLLMAEGNPCYQEIAIDPLEAE